MLGVAGGININFVLVEEGNEYWKSGGSLTLLLGSGGNISQGLTLPAFEARLTEVYEKDMAHPENLSRRGRSRGTRPSRGTGGPSSWRRRGPNPPSVTRLMVAATQM